MWFINRCGANPSIRWSCFRRYRQSKLDVKFVTDERTEQHDSLQYYNRFIAIPQTTNKALLTKFDISITINMVKKLKSAITELTRSDKITLIFINILSR